MAVIIPQVITEDRASGVSGITGSLTFDHNRNQYLSRQPSVGGNRQKWTWSGWINKTATSAEQQAFWSASFGPGSSASSDDQIFIFGIIQPLVVISEHNLLSIILHRLMRS